MYNRHSPPELLSTVFYFNLIFNIYLHCLILDNFTHVYDAVWLLSAPTLLHPLSSLWTSSLPTSLSARATFCLMILSASQSHLHEG